MKKVLFSILIPLIVIVGIFFMLNKPVAVQAVSGLIPITGYAWSDNIGWIQFNPSFGGVNYATSSGQLSGYAWSDNIGWIKFNGLSADSGVGGTGPVASTSTGLISGWARACAGTISGDCSSMTSRTDGWDGWIKFDHGKTNPAKIDFVTGDFHGYAWGSDVVGWVSLNCKEGSSAGGSVCKTDGGTSDYKITINPGSLSSSSSSSGSGGSSSSSGGGGGSSSSSGGGGGGGGGGGSSSSSSGGGGGGASSSSNSKPNIKIIEI